MSLKIDLMIILFVILFCVTSQIKMYILLMIFAFIHELGHMIAGIILGFKPQEIKINPMGMKIKFKPNKPNTSTKKHEINIKKAVIAMAGPLTNLIIVFIVAIIMKINNLSNSNIFITIIYANILIATFNLITIYPLDGGRIIKEILEIKLGLHKSIIYTYKISKITIIILTLISSIAILYINNISIIVILIYLWILVLTERKNKYLQNNIK